MKYAELLSDFLSAEDNLVDAAKALGGKTLQTVTEADRMRVHAAKVKLTRLYNDLLTILQDESIQL